MKNKLLLYSFIAVIAVASVNFVALSLYLYWSLWWFDNMSHFLGGLAIGLVSYWFYKKVYPVIVPLGFLRLALIIFVFVIIIGIGWEAFEYFLGEASNHLGGETYWHDTTYDLISDAVGALVASIIIYKNKLHG